MKDEEENIHPEEENTDNINSEEISFDNNQEEELSEEIIEVAAKNFEGQHFY